MPNIIITKTVSGHQGEIRPALSARVLLAGKSCKILYQKIERKGVSISPLDDASYNKNEK